MMNFIKNSIRNIIDIFPNIVLNEVDYSLVNIPKHWKLSQRHNKDIKDIITLYYKNLKQFYGSNLNNILNEIQVQCKDIKTLAEITPFFASITKDDDEIKSIFDDRLVELLFKYYILLIFNTYIKLIDINPGPIFKPALSIDEESIEPEITPIAPVDVTLVEPSEYIPQEQSFIEAATLAGAKQNLTNTLSSYLVTIIEIICDDKEIINYNKETIMSKILTSKEKEKDEITDYLKDLTDEERAVENIFKQHKLESWSIGLQKGLTQYVQENYDDERDKAEQQLLKEREISKQTGVNEFNKDIYAYEFDANADVSEDIEKEVYSLVDYPGEDEDEPAYGNDPEDYENY